ncbi:33061_t:CDS:2, partial [Racocetra persica]
MKITTDQKHLSDNTLTEQEAIRCTKKIARIFELYEQNSKVYNILFGEIGVLAKKLDNYHSEYISLKKTIKRLKRDVESLKTELEDLDDCVDKDTVIDLIHNIVPSLINEKDKSSSYSSKTSEESDSAKTFEIRERKAVPHKQRRKTQPRKKLIDELNTEILDSTENIITQSSSVPTGENNPESVDFLNLYRQIVKAED